MYGSSNDVNGLRYQRLRAKKAAGAPFCQHIAENHQVVDRPVLRSEAMTTAPKVVLIVNFIDWTVRPGSAFPP